MPRHTLSRPKVCIASRFCGNRGFPMQRHTISGKNTCIANMFSPIELFFLSRHTFSRPKVCIASRFCENRGFPMPRHTISGPKTCVANGFSPIELFPHAATHPFPAKSLYRKQVLRKQRLSLAAIHHFWLKNLYRERGERGRPRKRHIYGWQSLNHVARP